MARLLLTQSLLSDFAWVFRKEDGYADFLRTLRREPKETSKAMFAGIDFEDRVTAYAHGTPLDEKQKHAAAIRDVGNECYNGQFQVRLSREIEVEGLLRPIISLIFRYELMKHQAVHTSRWSTSLKM